MSAKCFGWPRLSGRRPHICISIAAGCVSVFVVMNQVARQEYRPNRLLKLFQMNHFTTLQTQVGDISTCSWRSRESQGDLYFLCNMIDTTPYQDCLLL